MPHSILVTIPQFTPDARAILSRVGTVTEAVPTQETLAGVLEPHDVVVAGLGLRFDRSIFERARRLDLLATATTGLDHLDCIAAEERGVAIVSLRGETAFLHTITGTAELAWGLVLDLLRGIARASASVRDGAWDREQFRGHELRGKTLGIVGLGRLGTMVARYGTAFGMTVLACDPYVSDDVFARVGTRRTDLDALLAASDVISLHVHSTPETERMIGAAQLARMQPGAVLVNTSRGELVDERMLIAALDAGTIAGYAADVLADEAAFGGSCAASALVAYARTHPNVILTPHIGGMTHESRAATDVCIAEKVVRWVQEQ